MSTALEGEVTSTAQRRPAAARHRTPVDGPSLRPALAAFASVAAAAQECTQMDDLLQVVARQICGLVGVSRCSIHMRDEREGLFLGCVCCVASPLRKVTSSARAPAAPPTG
jgi:hypothetical protein